MEHWRAMTGAIWQKNAARGPFCGDVWAFVGDSSVGEFFWPGVLMGRTWRMPQLLDLWEPIETISAISGEMKRRKALLTRFLSGWSNGMFPVR